MSKNTYASIKGNLEANTATYADKEFEICLQGSYGNDTNIRADSDVDVVMMLTSIWQANTHDLPQDQANAYRNAFSDATYRFSDFRNGVVNQLRGAYGCQTVRIGDKSIKIVASSNRLGADVIVCYQYRYYHHFYS